ncbi:MAG: hypothetical protein ACREKS_08190 [Candidatus Rokuibacteriota bacterium]
MLDAMTAAGYHAELRQSVFGWRAEFHRRAMQHSRSMWAGVGTDWLPGRAVQIGALTAIIHGIVVRRLNEGATPESDAEFDRLISSRRWLERRLAN